MTDKAGRAFLIRPYRTEDREALSRMYDAFAPKRCAQGLPPEDPVARGKWLDTILARGHHVLVEIDRDIVGHGMLIPFDHDVAELANFLHQSVRDRGIGTALNQVLVDMGRRERLGRIWLSVEPSNRPAIRSYEKAGFRRRPGSLWAPEMEMEVNLSAAEA